MLSNPKRGTHVELRYAEKKRRAHAGLHGAKGVVRIVGKGRPRNHGVELDDGRIVVVPAGNLRRIEE